MTVALLAVAVLATAQTEPQIKPMSGKVLVPNSSIEKPLDIGRFAHTNIQVFLPKELRNEQTSGPPYAGMAYETPASLACVYGLVAAVMGCNPNTVTRVPVGGARMIALVDAYDAPNAANDLAKFSLQFGLPPASFQVVYATGVKPSYDMGWEFEASLDVQWAHAMAPEAKIVLVEAASNSFKDLMVAEDVAAKMVNAAGGGEVSNSWGGGEFSGETAYDSHFVKPGVVFLASAGDFPGTSWPGTSPNVVSAGGTTVRRNPSWQLRSRGSLGFRWRRCQRARVPPELSKQNRDDRRKLSRRSRLVVRLQSRNWRLGLRLERWWMEHCRRNERGLAGPSWNSQSGRQLLHLIERGVDGDLRQDGRGRGLHRHRLRLLRPLRGIHRRNRLGLLHRRRLQQGCSRKVNFSPAKTAHVHIEWAVVSCAEVQALANARMCENQSLSASPGRWCKGRPAAKRRKNTAHGASRG